MEDDEYEEYLNSGLGKLRTLRDEGFKHSSGKKKDGPVKNLKVNCKKMINLCGRGVAIVLDGLGVYCGVNAIACIARGNTYSILFKAEWLCATALLGVCGYALTRKTFGLKSQKEKDEEYVKQHHIKL